MKVGIIMGSTSDREVMQKACDVFEELNIPYELKVISAHRTPELMFEFANSAKGDGYDVIIAGAGAAAHVPGMVAAITQVPVIGVPIWSKDFNGTDALLSIVQMPNGIPVATVGINRAANAALLAARMIGMNNDKVYQSLLEYQKNMKEKVLNTKL
ncbi:MAG: 5-(carboxyamino)imidazole ribonucleotide mutase [Desulfuromonadaceae bacterium]|nr:5-(carboxyamino)imidazole ribonucleotide mutase [Desulfuromonadaceae bacterium]